MRPYTPIECRPKECEFDTLIKIYPDGLMSQHVESLETGASLSIRGVSSDVTYSPNTICIPGFHENIQVKNLSMIAGGTGIAPCY